MSLFKKPKSANPLTQTLNHICSKNKLVGDHKLRLNIDQNAIWMGKTFVASKFI